MDRSSAATAPDTVPSGDAEDPNMVTKAGVGGAAAVCLDRSSSATGADTVARGAADEPNIFKKRGAGAAAIVRSPCRPCSLNVKSPDTIADGALNVPNMSNFGRSGGAVGVASEVGTAQSLDEAWPGCHWAVASNELGTGST